MRIIVSDSSCLIDLRKASLLDVFLRLPYEILVPNTLFEDELLRFSPAQKELLLRGGLQVIDLPAENVLRAQTIARAHARLSIHDAFAFALAESRPGSILLTGDGGLREVAQRHEIEVHGVLWVIDEIHGNGLASVEDLLAVLRGFQDDTTVRLPRRELTAAVKRYTREE